jgi:hypothetical protein
LAAVAASNGGREAGWIILDDVLTDPGVLVGDLSVEVCDQAVNVIDRTDATGGIKADAAGYALASELLVAQVNLAIGAEYCPAIDQAVRAGQLLLISLGYDGTGDYLGPEVTADDGELARFLADQLAAYNAGTLCQ